MVPDKARFNVFRFIESIQLQMLSLYGVVILCWLFICHISRSPSSSALLVFLSASLVMVLAAALAVWQSHRMSRILPFKWIFLSALLLRLLSLYGEPLFEDDHFRYQWDGYQTVTTKDPYSLPPAVFFDRDVPEKFEPILSLINYPEIATVYGPVAQWVFGVGYLIAPAEIWPLQLLAALADLMVLTILWRLGAGNAIVLYAWSPLLLKEFALTAHPDIYAILALMLAVFAVKKHVPWIAGIALGLGFGAKVFTILALPFLLSSRWSIAYWASILGFFLATVSAITLWFGTYLVWVPEGLLAMADSWLFNAGLYLLLLNVLEFQTIKIALFACFFGYGLVVFLRRIKQAYALRDCDFSLPRQAVSRANTSWGFRGDWLFLLFLLALPVINPWYVAWLLPFSVLYPRFWSWGLSYCCLLSYWYGANAGISGAGSLLLPTPVVIVEYSAVVMITVLARLAAWHFERYKVYTGA